MSAPDPRRAVIVRPRATAATDRLLDSITQSSLAVLGSGLVVVARLRLRWRLAIGVFVAVGGAIVTTEVLKRVLPRPDYPGGGGHGHLGAPDRADHPRSRARRPVGRGRGDFRT